MEGDVPFRSSPKFEIGPHQFVDELRLLHAPLQRRVDGFNQPVSRIVGHDTLVGQPADGSHAERVEQANRHQDDGDCRQPAADAGRVHTDMIPIVAVACRAIECIHLRGELE